MEGILNLILELIELVFEIFGGLVAFFLGSGLILLAVIFFVIKALINKARGNISQNQNESHQQSTPMSANNGEGNSARQTLLAKLEKIRQEEFEKVRQKASDYLSEEEVIDQSNTEIYSPPKSSVAPSTNKSANQQYKDKKEPSLGKSLSKGKAPSSVQEIMDGIPKMSGQPTLEVEKFDEVGYPLHDKLTDPERLAEAFILKELLDKPISLRNRNEQ